MIGSGMDVNVWNFQTMSKDSTISLVESENNTLFNDVQVLVRNPNSTIMELTAGFLKGEIKQIDIENILSKLHFMVIIQEFHV